MEDFEIVDLYWVRSQDAIVRTAEKYGGYCRAIAQRILFSQEDAQESVNDTYLAAPAGGAANLFGQNHPPAVLEKMAGSNPAKARRRADSTGPGRVGRVASR